MLEKTPTVVHSMILVTRERESWCVELGKSLGKANTKGQKRQKKQNWLCISYPAFKNDKLLQPYFHKSSCSVKNLAFWVQG